METDTPRRVTVGADGRRVVYLRGGELWVYDVGGAERRIAGEPGITEYATDLGARMAAYAVAGRLYRADLRTGEVATMTTARGPVSDPRPDPTGSRIGYGTGGGLHVVDDAGEVLLAGEPDPAHGGHPYVSWGVAEPTAPHFGRRRGWWWSPDGRSVLATRVDTGGGRRGAQGRWAGWRTDAGGGSPSRTRPDVSLHLLELDGGWVDVHWDRETYPYLVSVCWCEHGDPLVAVLRRPQQHGLVLAVDSRTGETQVHAELADPRWVEPVPGTPCHLPDGRVLVGGELAHDGYDARCLFADGTLLTPPSLYVRRVVGRLPGSTEILVEGSSGEPSEQHLFRVSTAVGTGGVDTRRLTTTPGWHRAAVGGDTLVIGTESLEAPGLQWAVYRGDTQVTTLAARRPSRQAVSVPRPQLARVTDRRLPAGVLYPCRHVTGRRLPVLVHAAGLDQGVRAVRADWAERQEWADTAGVAVVVVDHRGTPGVAPSFEKVIHRRLADLTLADLADALAALVGKHPDLDLGRVAIRGRGVGGWLAALAALRRPELFRCAIAEHPLVDWHDDAGTVPTERYLGLAHDAPDAYHHHSLLAAASEAPRGTVSPILLIPGPDPEPVRRLAEALAAAGHPHTRDPTDRLIMDFCGSVV